MKSNLLPLLQAKLHPPLADAPLVERARLTARFGRGLTRKLTLVIAPAGYGKTCLMAQAYRRFGEQGRTKAWLTLDTSDNDFAQLTRYLVGAVRSAYPAFGTPVTVLLEGGMSLSEETIVHVLANELSALATPFCLFLEDAHELADVRAVAVLRQLVAATPPHVQFVISSRSLLDVGTGRLRATGQLEEIHWNDLRFTDDEIREYFRRANELELSGETAAKVLEKTEGWAAALQLTSLAVANSGTLPALLDRLDVEEQGIAAYLAEDVLRHLPAEMRGFLLKIGPLDRVCGSLCDAVAGTHDAQERLQEIVARNIFIFSSDVARRWYRFHPLFSTFLRHQLERTSPGELTALYTKASAWFEGERAYDEAVEFALRAGTTERAAQILNAHAFDIWRAGHQSRLDGWARQIPVEMRRRYPKLRLVQAWSLILAGKMEGAIRILEDVSSELDAPFVADTRAELALRGDVLFLRLMVAFFKEDVGLAESLSEEWLAGAYSGDSFLRGAVKSVLAGARGLMYELSYAQREASGIAELLEESGASYGPIWLYSILGAIYLGAGCVAQAVTSLEQAISFATRIGGMETPLAAMPAMILAQVRYEQDEISEAGRLTAKYAALAAHLNFTDYQISAFLVPARLQYAAGDAAGALATLEHHERLVSLAQHRSPRIQAHLVHEKIWLLTRLRNFSPLAAILQRAGLAGPTEAFAPTRVGGAGRSILAQARIRAAISMDEAQRGLALARKWIRYTHERELPRPELAFRLLAALALVAMGDEPAAQRELRDAVRIAARAGIVRPLIDELEPVRALTIRTCVAMRATDPVALPFIDLLLPRLVGPAGGPGSSHGEALEERHAPPGTAPLKLSPRELEVLQLVAQGMSNREVGDGLGLTENTVKWNLRQLFQKLAVQRRSQAVRRAREIGIIS